MKQRWIIEQSKIAPKHGASFTEFYHHEYLPEVLKLPGITCINRYEEYGTKGSLAWFDQSFLTIYDLSKEIDTIETFEKLFDNLPSALQKRMNETPFSFFYRDLYKLIYSHKKEDVSASFGSGPFFVVTVETEGEEKEAFQKWYEQKYLPKTMADIPTWTDCKRLESTTRLKKHTHTVYKAGNIHDLERGFELLRAPYRFRSNEEWDSWVGHAITKQNATSFQQIYHRSK